MDSESDDGFERQPGEALDIGEDFDSDDNQEQLSEEENNHPPLS